MSARYFIHRHEAVEGPFTTSQLRSMWDAGAIHGEMDACEEGSESWRKLKELNPVSRNAPISPPATSTTATARIGLVFVLLFVALWVVALVATGNVSKFIATVCAPDQWPGMALGVGGMILYFLPSVIASRRNAARRWAIFFINLIFGWTIIGYIAAFIWVCVDKREA